MRTGPRLVVVGSLLLALAVVAYLVMPVTLKTGALYPDAQPGTVGCYTSGTSGELVTDPSAGTAIIESDGRRVPVTWPIGWTGRRSLGAMDIVDQGGNVVARTGTHVNLMGGYWLDGSFLTCGPVPG